MSEILKKISSYNIFNYLLPGAILAFWLTKYCEINILQTNIFNGVFLYYFLGMVVSRVGSLILEPLLKKMRIIKYESYDSFLAASKTDENINVLSEVNNMYRTFTALFSVIAVIHVYIYVKSRILFLNDYGIFIAVIALLLLFLFSYRKQTKYITNRLQTDKNT